MLRRIALISSLSVAIVGGALAHTAHAAGPLIGVSDDRTLLGGGKRANQAVAEWKRDGVDVVRIYALWRRYAPSPNARHTPKGFNASDPNDPGYAWASLDQAVDKVRAAGMQVMLTISGPAPRWATGKHKASGTYEPDPKAFAAYASAVAARYGDVVDTYVLWNEPNSGAFLQPQTRHGAIVSGQIYRDLVRAGYPAVRSSDPVAPVLIVALAPKARVRRGSTTSPLAFLRAFGCVDASMRKVRTGACRHYKAPRGDAFAVHPYGAKTPPDLTPHHIDDVNIASLARVEATIDGLRRIGRLKGPRHMDIYIDEFGYQTDPPDRTSGVSPRDQDLWMQRGDYLAWRDHRVKLLTQYLWYDEPKYRGHYSLWQSGVRYVNGRAKPSLRHFATPFALDTVRNRLWGQVRPGGRQRVTVQMRRRGGSWRTLKRVRTDSRGYWTLRRTLVPGASYRFKTTSATSSALRR